MNKHRFQKFITWAVLLVLLATNIFILHLLLTNSSQLSREVGDSVRSEVAKIQVGRPKDGADGLTPVKGIDYFDGINGKDVTDEQVLKTVESWFAKHPLEVIRGGDGRDGREGEKGVDGVTPQIRCNISKNRWEMRYGEDQLWQLLNNEKVKCTPEVL